MLAIRTPFELCSVGSTKLIYKCEVFARPKLHFTLKVSKDGSFSDLPSGNNRLTSDQQEALKRLRRGNVIYLEDILVSMPDGTERDLPPMKLKITG